MNRLLCLCLAIAFTTGCSTQYRLMEPETAKVARGAIEVTPTIRWNKVPGSMFDIREEESWTLNGAVLDLVTFIGGLEDGAALARQRKKADRQVPIFRSDMSPPELVGMIESYYRLKAATIIFETTEVKPVDFLSATGMQIDYSYVTTDNVKRRGRTVLAVIDKKLYLMSLDGTALHYFDAAVPEFELMVQSASLS